MSEAGLDRVGVGVEGGHGGGGWLGEEMRCEQKSKAEKRQIAEVAGHHVHGRQCDAVGVVSTMQGR